MKFTDENDNYRAGRPADRLEALKKRFKKARKGFRLEKYDVVEQTMQSVVEMRSDIDELKEFVERNDIDPKKLDNTDKKWITLVAFTFVSGENLGWKCARVAEFLYDFKKVPINQLAEQIRKLGGIEKIVRLAAEEDPRQLKDPGGIKKKGSKAGKGPRRPLKAASADEHISGVDQDDDPGDKPGSSTIDDGTMLVGINGALRAELEEVAEGESVELIVTRTGGWGEAFLFEVEKVIHVVKKRTMRWGKPAKAKRKP
jgi:hypothetical protein